MIIEPKKCDKSFDNPVSIQVNGETVCVTSPDYYDLILEALVHLRKDMPDEFKRFEVDLNSPIEGRKYKVTAYHKGIKKTWDSIYQNGSFWADGEPINKCYINKWKAL